MGLWSSPGWQNNLSVTNLISAVTDWYEATMNIIQYLYDDNYLTGKGTMQHNAIESNTMQYEMILCDMIKINTSANATSSVSMSKKWAMIRNYRLQKQRELTKIEKEDKERNEEKKNVDRELLQQAAIWEALWKKKTGMIRYNMKRFDCIIFETMPWDIM